MRISPRKRRNAPGICRASPAGRPKPCPERTDLSHRRSTPKPSNCFPVPRARPKARYSSPVGLLTRWALGNPYRANQTLACPSLSRWTNANCVPAASISRRFCAISARASRQNVQPKWRRKITRTGEFCESASRLTPPSVGQRSRTAAKSLESNSTTSSRRDGSCSCISQL